MNGYESEEEREECEAVADARERNRDAVEAARRRFNPSPLDIIMAKARESAKYPATEFLHETGCPDTTAAAHIGHSCQEFRAMRKAYMLPEDGWYLIDKSKYKAPLPDSRKTSEISEVVKELARQSLLEYDEWLLNSAKAVPPQRIIHLRTKDAAQKRNVTALARGGGFEVTYVGVEP